MRRSLVMMIAVLVVAGVAHGQYEGWKHSGTLYILTDAQGAALPEGAVVEEFPLLVRLHKDWFNFAQATEDGQDIRFSSEGKPLVFQVESWDPANGSACIWVRVPVIRGNARQAIRMHWGNPEAASESNGRAVFNASNGYLGVWHMGQGGKDEVGLLACADTGTAAAPGVIGQARRFDEGKGIKCGESITGFPSGAEPSTTEAWVRADRVNVDLVAWGNEGGGRGTKVRMRLASPPHLRIDSDFADVKGASRLPMDQWIHVVHTYSSGDSRVYVDGRLDGATKPMFGIKSPARMWIGGWYNQFSFIGCMDEVRVSKVARSADWIRLQYENQKPLQTAAGMLIRPGSEFSASPQRLSVPEGKAAAITARADGAQKLYWVLKGDGADRVVAVDQLVYTQDAGRVTGDKSLNLQLKAIYPDGVRTRDIPVTITEAIPEPAFTLEAPARWDGRQTIEVRPRLSNLPAMKAADAGEPEFAWTVSGLATIREQAPGKLLLTRAQNSGKLTVTLALRNGGVPVTQSATIDVKEPEKDAWVERTPDAEEMPEDNQFYARDDRNEGTLYCKGTLKDPADAVFLTVYADDQVYKSEQRPVAADRAYAFAVKLKPGLIRYRTEFGTVTGDRRTILHRAGNLVCGDAYLIDGQSNAVATDIGRETYSFTSDWIRTYGCMGGGPNARTKLWGNAVFRGDGKLQIGYWGMELGRRLVESQKMPICIINGAVGGSRIDQHQRNPADPEDIDTIYGRLLWRVRQARLTHGIRGVLWHQGENDQGADGPTGGFGWETYEQYFIDMSAGWKQDYPNIQHYYLFQIWPKACAMGVNGSDNILREVQRRLPRQFSRMSIMSTLGIKPEGGCHYPAAGYAEFARLICPLIERDHYGKAFDKPITPPDVLRAYYTSDKHDEIALEFDQQMAWADALCSQFLLDAQPKCVAAGMASGRTITLKLKEPSQATKIAYLDSATWSPDNLLYGENGIAALTFWDVPILPRWAE